MSRLRGVLELEVRADRAAEACREAFKDLAWELLVDDGVEIGAREDATRLHCHCWPGTTRVRVDRADGNGTALAIETDVPGLGPISSNHARERQAAVVRMIHSRASRLAA